MSYERHQTLVTDLCQRVGLPHPQVVLERGSIDVEGFEVLLDYLEEDPDAMYLNFNFGIVSAGRTLPIFQLLLESNVTVYAQDQAQAGVHPDTGSVLLMVRIPFEEGVDGAWLLDTLSHYVEHGRYWRDSILSADDDMFIGICSGEYSWIKA